MPRGSDGQGAPSPSLSNRHHAGNKQRRILQVRLRLLAKRSWEFAMRESQGYWTVGLHHINHRPSDAHAFHYVRTGNIEAVDKLISARELSIWDAAEDMSGSYTLLQVPKPSKHLQEKVLTETSKPS